MASDVHTGSFLHSGECYYVPTNIHLAKSVAPQCPRVSEQTSSAVGQCHTFPTWQHQQIMTKKSQLIVSASATPDHICIKPNNYMSTSREVRAKCHEAKVERKCQISAVLCHLTSPVVIPSTSIRTENATSFCTTAL